MILSVHHTGVNERPILRELDVTAIYSIYHGYDLSAHDRRPIYVSMSDEDKRYSMPGRRCPKNWIMV